MSARVEWISDAARFGEVAAAWDELGDHEGTPFSRHAWFSSWWRAFGDNGRMRVLALWRGERLAAGLPLVARGAGLHGMVNVHTPLFRPTAAGQSELEEAVRVAVDCAGGELVVCALPAGGEDVDALSRASREHRRLLVREAQHVSPIVDTHGDLEVWRRETKPRWRVQLDRLRRKAERENALQIDALSRPRDLEDELRTGFHIEAGGWKGRAGTAILSHPTTECFYRTLARAFHERGELRTSWIYLDGRPAAFDLCLLDRGRVYLLKRGHDEAYRKLAPGLLLCLAQIERCFTDGLDALELLGDDAEWKRKFATSERRHVCLRAYRRMPGPGARYAYRRMRPQLRRAYRAVKRSRARTR